MVPKLRVPAALILFAASVIFLFSVFCSVEPFNWLLTNSDSLLPADLLNDFVNHLNNFTFFQFPRVPSLFPDLFFYLLITEITRSWIWTIGIYACLMQGAMLLVCGAICRDMSQVSLNRSILVVLACTILGFTLGTHVDGITNAYLYIMLPVYHAGPFLLALCGLIIARAYLERAKGKTLVALALIAALGTLSDRLFVGSFLVPLVGFFLLCNLLTKNSVGATKWSGWPVVLWAIIGCVAGYICDLLIFSHWLNRQPDLPINLQHQFGRLNLIWHDSNIGFECLCTVFILGASFVRFKRNIYEKYWLIVACISSVGFLLIQPLLWDGPTSSRYAQPIWWWTLLVVAFMLCRIRWRFTPCVLLLAAVAILVVFISSRRETFSFPPTIARPNPLVACLIQLKKDGAIHDGLAGYWVTRPAEAKSNWELQIAQVTPVGTAFVWGNNTKYYLYSKQSMNKPAALDYIILKDLDENQLRRRFGLPDQIARCPSSDIWIYRDPTRLRLNLGDIATVMDRGRYLSRSACLGPGQFTNQAGPIPASGIDISINAQPLSFATWGPYIGMQHGMWDLELTYRLKKVLSQPAILDAAADSGQTTFAQTELPATDGKLGTQTLFLNLKKDKQRVEFRTRLAAQDHLEIVNLRVQRQGLNGNPCGANTVER